MCLYIHKEKTKEAKKNKTDKVVRWKVVKCINFKYLRSPFFPYTWTIGWNKADRKTTDVGVSTFRVETGIHVYTSREEARWIVRRALYRKIIRVICYKKDLIAIGWDRDEVYTKVFVPKDEYDSAIKRKGTERRR